MRIALFCSGILMLSLAARGASPTMDEIHKAMQDGQYEAAVQKISQALTLHHGAGEGQDRYDLLMLKGECLLNLKSANYALDAFRDAMNVAPDRAKANVALANAILIEHSPNLVYVSTSGRAAEPIDIVPPEKRKQGMKLLYTDWHESLEPRINAALSSPTLPPMVELLPNLTHLYAVEWAADGSAPKTGEVLQAMGARARDLMSQELLKANDRVQEIEAQINQMVVVNGIITPAGLSTFQRRELTDIGQYVKRIEDAARDARRMAHRLGAPGDRWEGVIADAADLVNAVDTMLRRR